MTTTKLKLKLMMTTASEMTRVSAVWDAAGELIAQGEPEVAVLACLLVGAAAELREVGGQDQVLASLALIEDELRHG